MWAEVSLGQERPCKIRSDKEMWEQAPPNVKAEFTEAARIEKEEHARLSVQYSLL
jgi:hypothetical protein